MEVHSGARPLLVLSFLAVLTATARRQVFEGHTHYIMNLAFNPKDSNTFASACLDRTVKVWSLGSPTANFTLDAHDKGVNYVEFYHGGDKPYLVTTGDDRCVRCPSPILRAAPLLPSPSQHTSRTPS